MDFSGGARCSRGGGGGGGGDIRLVAVRFIDFNAYPW